VMLQLGLLSERLEKPARSSKSERGAAKSLTGAKKTSKKGSVSSKKGAEAPAKPPEDPIAAAAPKLSTTIVVIGVAPTHKDIARFVASLQECALLSSVELKFSETTIIQDREMKKFRLEARIADNADARRIELLESPRIRTLDDLAPDPEELLEGGSDVTSSTPNRGESGQ